MDNEQEQNNSGASETESDKPKVNQKIAKKVKDKSKKHKRKIVFYYSFLTFVLLFCIIQVGFSVILNTSKTIAYIGKIKTMNKVRDEAEQRNKDLKNDIKLFSKASGFWSNIKTKKGTINSAYGNLIFNSSLKDGRSQFDWAFDSLKNGASP